jgi:hypothetical protein
MSKSEIVTGTRLLIYFSSQGSSKRLLRLFSCYDARLTQFWFLVVLFSEYLIVLRIRASPALSSTYRLFPAFGVVSLAFCLILSAHLLWVLKPSFSHELALSVG